jgi:hypothetical protein
MLTDDVHKIRIAKGSLSHFLPESGHFFFDRRHPEAMRNQSQWNRQDAG